MSNRRCSQVIAPIMCRAICTAFLAALKKRNAEMYLVHLYVVQMSVVHLYVVHLSVVHLYVVQMSLFNCLWFS